MSKIYLFDGNAGCDLCKEATGYWIDEEPLAPHVGCDCPIIEVNLDDPLHCELMLQDLTIDEYELFEHHEVVLSGCGETEDTEVAFTYTEDEVQDFDEGLRALAQDSGWSPPDSQHLSGTLELEKNRIHTVHVEITRYVAIFEAEATYVCHPEVVNAPDVTIPAGHLFGFYEKNIDQTLDRDVEDCPGYEDNETPVPDLADDEALASYLGGDDDDTG